MYPTYYFTFQSYRFDRVTHRNQKKQTELQFSVGEVKQDGSTICRERFTLIELLVVIAIIGILASLLMPALQQARNQAKQMSCGSNLSQMGKAVMMYTNDYEDWLPVSSTDGNLPGQWKADISPYLSGKELSIYNNDLGREVYACPSSKVNLDEPVYRQGGYGWNYKYMGFNDVQAAPLSRLKLNNIPNLLETALAGDTVDWGTFSQKMYLYRSTIADPSPGVGNRHNKGINLLWADFHMEWMSQNNLRAGKDGNADYYYLKTKP